MSVSTSRLNDRAWVEINLDHLIANGRTIQEAAGSDPLLPMVKADAYGLGAVPVARALEALDPWGFGVVTVAEAIELRAAGIARPLLVFTPAQTESASVYHEYDLRAVIDRADVARGWELPFHVEIDTGMGRCGVRWDDAVSLGACDTEQLEGAFTHFRAADEGTESVSMQWERFVTALAVLPVRPPLVHAANSAAVWRLDERLNLVRPGIFLYGGEHAHDLPRPHPVASVRAPVMSVRDLPAGEGVSYGGEWVAGEPVRIATLAIGYADGVSRTAARRASVVLKGRRYPVVGRITMDFIMIALPRDFDVAVGDVATVFGEDGGEAITVDEFAGWADTNAYEALSRLGPRLARRYMTST